MNTPLNIKHNYKLFNSQCRIKEPNRTYKQLVTWVVLKYFKDKDFKELFE